MVALQQKLGVEFERLLSCPNVRPSPLETRLPDGRVRCEVCERRCHLREESVGFCGTKANLGGRLHTLVYGDVSSISSNPIEKKPFFHFWPGSEALTIGTWGCNFTCRWCQNFDISKSPPDPTRASFLSPEKFVNHAISDGCQGTSISFNEPTMLFEYALDVFPLARRRGLYNTYVSNGYMSEDALKMLKEAGMDAIKFDVKGGKTAVARQCAANVEIVWRNIRRARELGLHIEVVMLLIPGINDDETSVREVAKKHVEEAGQDRPLHFTRFYPAYKMMDRPPTSIASMEAAHAIAKEEGVLYAYLGNVPGHRLENTFCHNCGRPVIERYGSTMLDCRLTRDGRCLYCGQVLPVIVSKTQL
jgi:pyruvate formate lyase activating enzyme